MGSGYAKKCSKCGFTFSAHTGVGFLFPKDYADTIQEAKDGKLGQEIQSFFEEHPNGAINAESVVLCCKQCGHLSTEKDLTMYVPNDNNQGKIEHGRWSVAMPFEGAGYVDRSDLEEHYKEYAKYPHKCEECGGAMRVVNNEEELLCPKCKEPMETAEAYMWD